MPVVFRATSPRVRMSSTGTAGLVLTGLTALLNPNSLPCTGVSSSRIRAAHWRIVVSASTLAAAAASTWSCNSLTVTSSFRRAASSSASLDDSMLSNFNFARSSRNCCCWDSRSSFATLRASISSGHSCLRAARACIAMSALSIAASRSCLASRHSSWACCRDAWSSGTIEDDNPSAGGSTPFTIWAVSSLTQLSKPAQRCCCSLSWPSRSSTTCFPR
mmetsp:Transcript_116405/g.267210  ORF Transcript_116405/g.267210 Transcript_116405/m.267210 type:complete len:218 (+) Transcript_116405:673-1326(+)